jgi:fatty acid desaturase
MVLFVPCWRLRDTHRLLVRKGLAPRMEIQPGYRPMLRVATSAASDRRPEARTAGPQHI